METGQIFFYNPDANNKQSGGAVPRQQSHWVPHPMPVGPAQQPTPPPAISYLAPTQAYAPLRAMPTVAAPQPTYHYNTNFLHLEVDGHSSRAVSRGDTATPPLTRCPSENNTPSPQSAASDYLPTPSQAYFPLEFNVGFEGVKPGCEREASEVLASTEWSNDEMQEFMQYLTPPVTPGM